MFYNGFNLMIDLILCFIVYRLAFGAGYGVGYRDGERDYIEYSERAGDYFYDQEREG
jgi:hypothetical protein